MQENVDINSHNKTVWPPPPLTEQIAPDQKSNAPYLRGFIFGCVCTAIVILGLRNDVIAFNLSFGTGAFGIFISMSDIKRNRATHQIVGILLSVLGIALNLAPTVIYCMAAYND